jgi:hypothetical protein
MQARFPFQIEDRLEPLFVDPALTDFFFEVGACGPNGRHGAGTSAEP